MSHPARPRVLVVEDNPDFQDNLSEILEAAGYEVMLASSCAEATDRAGAGFDVALVDLRLPDGDGTTLARQLKESTPESEVVLLTGHATVETAVQAVRAGACAYLMKPIATSELLLTIEQAMRQVRLHTEKIELARKARISERLAAVGTLTAGLSHEIRNPLNAATLQLQVLERRLRKLPEGEQPPLLEPLLLVRDEIRRLDHILEDFLHFARPRELRAKPVAVGPLLDRVVNLLSGEAQTRGIRLETIVPEVPPILGDEEQLRQVLINLALNALDATPPEGWVRLTAEHQGHEVVLYVDDSGPGLPQKVRMRLFEPFFTTKAAGTGLGLSIVHTIVGQHGGSISAGSAPEGGARFTIRMPQAQAETE